MILLDANLLLYAYHSQAPEHPSARRWFEAVMSGAEPVLLPWSTLLAFLRISTNPRVWQRPFTIQEAAAIVEEWLAVPNLALVGPGERHWAILRGLLVEGKCRGPLVTDAHLAALAIEHGATLATCDRDFMRFPAARLLDPLA
jgi:uncharacterized protein